MNMQRGLAEPWEAGSERLGGQASRTGCAKLVVATKWPPPPPILIPEYFPINTGGETHQEKHPWESAGSEG